MNLRALALAALLSTGVARADSPKPSAEQQARVAQAFKEYVEPLPSYASDETNVGLFFVAPILQGGKFESGVWKPSQFADMPERTKVMSELREAVRKASPLVSKADPALLELALASCKKHKLQLPDAGDAQSMRCPVVAAAPIESKFSPTVNEMGTKVSDTKRVALVVQYGDVCLQLRATQVRSHLAGDRDNPEFIEVEWHGYKDEMAVSASQDVRASFVACPSFAKLAPTTRPQTKSAPGEGGY